MSVATVATLELAEAVELGYVLVARVADNVGARALAIKGRVNEAHGLRAPRASADADVLVEPTRLDDVVTGLLELGWRKVPTPSAPAFAYHSVTLNHPQWPCELDVHDRFPGFLAEPDVVFDALWAERTDLAAANVAVPATGIYGSTLVMGLHALRTPSDQRNGRELAGLVERLSSERLNLARLQDLASATGCLATARPLLHELGVMVPHHPNGDRRIVEWEVRRSTAQTRNLGWLLAVRRTPPWRWPGIVLRAVLADEPYLRHFYPQAPTGKRGLWLARWWRLKVAFRDLPGAVGTARRLPGTGSR
ncbi:hypothetical protein SAMN04487968_102105 [Nocardioides terrae]|uniref:Nucleotidyltransferase n=1 Tax=Nocardioides terrae TaxID=574651 RepID=A0A1I1EKR7_9ACTN|nr:nucleotidyltransferase family protein [Nocardioides terrae]SFB87236.1 hypothetical protein SAMN04487968_102105 [Nocardioides terrae]